MLKYRGPRLIKAGFIGATLIVLVIAVGMAPDQLASLATRIRYQAAFSEAGGLNRGDDVTVAGIKVGTVSDIELHNGDALVSFTVASTVALGSESTAHIRTGTLLGKRTVTLESAGPGRLHSSVIIPKSRTSSPYSLTEAVSDLTTNISGTNTATLNQSLDALSATIDAIAPQLAPTFDGVTRVSRALNERNHALSDLLSNVGQVSGILSSRSQEVNTLIVNANDLVQVLVQRRRAIVELLSNTSALSRQLSGVIHDNESKLAPTLEKLNSVTAVLQKDRDQIAKALPGLAKFELTLGEAVSSGPYYQAQIQNIALPQILLQPWMDYVFGFRRGNNTGQPPDNAGPRAELPFPYNGIPQPGDRPWFDHPEAGHP